MIGCDHHQGISILFGKIQGGCNDLFKIQHLANQVFRVVVVTGPVNLGTFYHQEKTLLILGKVTNGQNSCIWKEITPSIYHGRHGSGLRQKTILLITIQRTWSREAGGINGKTFFGSQQQNICTVCTLVKFGASPSCKKIDLRVEQLDGDLLFHTALLHMGIERCGRGM